MKFVVTKSVFLKALKNALVSLSTAKFALPVLSSAKISAENNGKISVVVTNLETQTADAFPAEVSEEGEILVPMQTLFDVIKTMPSDDSRISFDVSNDSEVKIVNIKCDKRSFKIKSLAASDFPNIFADEFDKTIHIPSSILRNLFKKTSFSMSTSPDRYNLNGLYITTEKDGESNNLVVVATDGHRLAMAKKEIDSDFSMIGKIFPRKAIAEVIKILESSEAIDCALSISENKASFVMDELRFYTKLLDASFPDYKKVIPSNNTKVLEVENKLLQNEISAISTISKERGLNILISNNMLTISMLGSDGNNSDSEISCVFSEKEDFKTMYNPKFLLECLGSLDSEKVRFGFGQENSPVLIQSMDNGSFYYVVMPMKGENI